MACIGNNMCLRSEPRKKNQYVSLTDTTRAIIDISQSSCALQSSTAFWPGASCSALRL